EDHRGPGGDAQDPPKVQAGDQDQQEVLRSRRAELGSRRRCGEDSREAPAKQAEALDAGRSGAPLLPAASRRSSSAGRLAAKRVGRSDFRTCAKTAGFGFVSGHDFSRAVKGLKKNWALASEGKAFGSKGNTVRRYAYGSTNENHAGRGRQFRRAQAADDSALGRLKRKEGRP